MRSQPKHWRRCGLRFNQQRGQEDALDQLLKAAGWSTTSSTAYNGKKYGSRRLPQRRWQFQKGSPFTKRLTRASAWTEGRYSTTTDERLHLRARGSWTKTGHPIDDLTGVGAGAIANKRLSRLNCAKSHHKQFVKRRQRRLPHFLLLHNLDPSRQQQWTGTIWSHADVPTTSAGPTTGPNRLLCQVGYSMNNFTA